MSDRCRSVPSAARVIYRPDIDGLRALAVLPVVFYHAGFDWFSGGYVGVDVFFVISGYLITSLIYPEIQAGKFTYRSFYVRRIRRLFPALFVLVVACLIPAYYLLLPGELEDFGESVAALALFSSNILFWSEAGYFATAAELKPLLHTWSLAIEEQYYLLFPVLLLGIRRWSPKYILPVTLVLFTASLIWAITSLYSSPDAAFYLLPSRTWELLLGSLIAMGSVELKNRWASEASALTGVCLIVAAVLLYDNSTPFPGAAALLPCVGTALVIIAGTANATVTRKILSYRGLVFIGLISYSLYLWHWPILAFAKHYYIAPLGTQVVWVALSLALLMSVLSWRYVEQPFRRAGTALQPRALFQGAAAMIIILISVGLVLDTTQGLPVRLPDKVHDILAVADDKPKNRKRCEGQDPATLALSELCPLGDPTVSPSVLLWGDSHANMLANTLGTYVGEAQKGGAFAVANGCVPLLGVSRAIQDTDLDCAAFSHAVLQLIAEHPSLSTIVLAARWGLHATGLPVDVHAGPPRYLRNAQTTAQNSADNQHIFTEAFRHTLATLESMDRRVIVLGPIPEANYDIPMALAKAAWRNTDIRFSTSLAGFNQRQATFFALQREYNSSNIQWMALHQPLCNEVQCRFTKEGLPLYFDDNHLATNGVAHISGVFDNIKF
jgi:peptidoglycan/LPS O-acetylase OafA/YrhL